MHNLFNSKLSKILSLLETILTVNIGILDVDGFGGSIISRRESVVYRTEDLQHSFSQTGLEHHTATSHANILTARVQVRDTHRYYTHENNHT